MRLIFSLFILSIPIYSSASSVTWNNFSFEIDVPQTWKKVENLYGIPVTFLGPSVSPKPRAVVQVIPTSSKPIPMKEEDAKSFGEKYAEGRKRWVNEQKGEILDILPGKFDDGKLFAGVSYKVGTKRYLERTYYINCPKNLVHLKIILNFENLDSLKVSESIVRSFSCGH